MQTIDYKTRIVKYWDETVWHKEIWITVLPDEHSDQIYNHSDTCYINKPGYVRQSGGFVGSVG